MYLFSNWRWLFKSFAAACMILQKYAGCVLCQIPLPAYCVPRLWSLCFRSRLTWIRWHEPEAIFSEQVWERKLLENISSLVALTLTPLILSLSLSSSVALSSFFFSPSLPAWSSPQEILKWWKALVFFPLSFHTFIIWLFSFPVYMAGGWATPSERDESSDDVIPPLFSVLFPCPTQILWTQRKAHHFPPTHTLQLAIRPLLNDLLVLSTQSSHPCQGQLNIWRPSFPTAIDSHWYDTGVNCVICVVIKKRRRSKAQWQEAAVGLAVFLIQSLQVLSQGHGQAATPREPGPHADATLSGQERN